MKHKSGILATATLLSIAAGTAHAEFSVTPAVVSDYDWRGTSQSATDPAAQLGVDWSGNGLHVGAWASTIDFGAGNPKLELDGIIDYSFGQKDGPQFGVGYTEYSYPDDSSWNFGEAFFNVNYQWFSAALWYSSDYFGSSDSAIYLEGNASIPVGDSGYSVTAHAGNSSGDYFRGGGTYTDYSVGVEKSFSHFDCALKWVGSDQPVVKSNIGNTESRLILSVSTTLPWGK